MKRLLLTLAALCAVLPVRGYEQQASPTPAPKVDRRLVERLFGAYPKITPFTGGLKKPGGTPTAAPAAASTPRHRRRHEKPAAEGTSPSSPSEVSPTAKPAAAVSAAPSPAAAAGETPENSKSRKSRRRKHRRGAAPGESPSASPAPGASPVPAASETPAPVPKPTATPTPAPTAAPTPVPAEVPTPPPGPSPKKKRGRHGKGAASATPSPAEAAPLSPLNAPNPFVPSGNEAPAPPVESTADQDAQERAHFTEVKTKALEDDKVLGLKEKMDTAATEEEQGRASKVYYKALYEKMRKLDPSLKDRIDRMEAITSKRIEQMP